MIKQLQFFGRDERGRVFCQPLLDDGLVKTASATSRANLQPKIAEFVKVVRPTKHGIYVLVNALGAGEIWGSNINGDHFPERELIHAPSDWESLSIPKMKEIGKAWEYGFPTFMGAHPYKHHINKDSSRAFGSVEIAAWNPKMRRVELVVYLDRELCKKFDAYDIIERVERGEFPDVSMGCRIPYDVCSICQHKSKTPKDYCDHAKNMMNTILPDGRKVFLYNPRPRFFDISFVFIGADKTAKVMAKLASRGAQVCLGEYCVIPRLSAEVGEVFSKEASAEIKEMSAPIKTEAPESAEAGIGGVFDPTLSDFTKNKPHRQLVRETSDAKPAFESRIYPPAHLDANDSYSALLSLDAGSQAKSASVKTANDPVKKFIHVQGIPVMLEWLKGDTRQYKSGFSKKMKTDYGYIPATVDTDGEQLDVYVGPKRDSELVFVIDQLRDDGNFDEQKIMLGYSDEETAEKSYLQHMPQHRLGHISRVTMEEFKRDHLVRARTARANKDGEKTAGRDCGCFGLGDDCGGTAEKVALAVFPGVRNNEKSASHRKLSEIIKSIPAGPFSKETLPKLERGERDIPKQTLNRMGEMDICQALSTPAMMGIVLKPHEFQRVVLVRIGETPLADELDQRGEVFGPTSEINSALNIQPDRVHHLLKELLQEMGFFRDRSVATAPLSRRIDKLKQERREPKQKVAASNDPIFNKLSAAYNGYRRSIIKKAAAIENYLVSDPQLATELFDSSMAKAFAGGIDKTSRASVLGSNSLAYLIGAHHQDRDFHIADIGVRMSLAQTGALAEAMS